MSAKYGFSVMFVAFGALAFGAGLVAPDAFRASVWRWITPAAVVKPAAVVVRLPPAPATASAARSESASAASASAPAAVPIESLAVPAPAPERRQYALQAGRFASADAAAALVATIRQQGMPSTPAIKVVDLDGRFWFLVAIGPYASLDEARAARAQAALRLPLRGGMPAVLLPPAPTS